MTAPTEEEIRALVTTATWHGPEVANITIAVRDELSDAFSEVCGRLDRLYDIDDMRPSEVAALDRIVSEATAAVRERATVDMEAALVSAAIAFAAEYPDAPRAKLELMAA